ncbi:PucR family transcriptional regulator ligand-binding domain-containing protein [Streptomonospora sp. S1-112]|uniref:PucR family transcriptional regulator ligand-binding domain-containing protein n=1 Tax=Streptomonospora mangrovi TaxID=2883123 RepID=A0A9X3NQW9_9ACTN|nr:PucR family transcriptional regulator [Streptomonospora mangrovi]MDA0566733.1 PucR family transcriptional regulator ligand-binding domain-containing protein [Streptomonospora mangrovi]
MRISDLVAVPHLKLRLLGGGEPADRAVSGVATTDLLHPERYLSGGELVLTGMMWRRRPEDSAEFVRALAGAGAACVGAGTALGEVPPDLVAACAEHGLPLVEVPAETSFAAVTEEVRRALDAERDDGAARTRERHRRLLAELAGGADLPGVFAAAAAQARLACWVVSTTGRLLASGGPALGERERLRVAAQTPVRPGTRTLDLAAAEGAPARRLTVLPVRTREWHPLAGWLLVCEGDPARWPADVRESVDHLAAIAALARNRVEQRAADAARHLEGLPRLLAAQRFEEVAALLRVAGPPDEKERARTPHAVVEAALLPAPAEPDLARRVLAELLAAWPGAAVTGADPAFAVVPVAEDAPRADTGGAGEPGHPGAAPAPGGPDRLRRHLAEGAAALESRLLDHRLAAGVSAAVTGVADLRGAAAEARHARRLAEMRPGRAVVATGAELDSHELLLSAVPEEVRAAYRDRLLGPLLAYDRAHRSDLLATLERFLRYSGSWQRCASAMHIHVNTLRYRIGRIEELTGRDLSSLEHRVDLFLALRLHR